MEGQNKDGVEKYGKVGRVYLIFVVISFCSPWLRGMVGAYKAVNLKQKTDVTGARYVRTIWPCVLIIMIIKWLLSRI